MFTNFVEWRKQHDVDNAIKRDYSPIIDFAKVYWEHSYYSVSRDGYPVYIERYAKTDIDKLLKSFSEKQIKEYYSNSYECMIHCIWPECSRVAGRRIDAIVTILDVKGLGVMRMMKSDTRAFLAMASQVAQDYYPECQGKMFIINTGMTFSALWAVIKLMLDQKTRDKISVLGTKFYKELTKYVSPENIPETMGGECKKDLFDAPGPWTSYTKSCYKEGTYFADGVKQGDPWKEPARKEIGYNAEE